MTRPQAAGAQGEQAVHWVLVREGWTITDRQVKAAGGHVLDLLGIHPAYGDEWLIEVKVWGPEPSGRDTIKKAIADAYDLQQLGEPRPLLLVFAEPPAVVDLDDEQLRLLAEHAVAQDAAGVAYERMLASGRIGPGVADPEVESAVQRIRHRAAATVRPRPGRRPVSDEEKLRILELYETKGIAETMAITGRAERTVRRHIADARRIEGEG
jgi:hypothetical protein